MQSTGRLRSRLWLSNNPAAAVWRRPAVCQRCGTVAAPSRGEQREQLPHRRGACARAAAQDVAQQQQQQVPPLVALLDDRDARLTTVAQLAWAQALSPGDSAVDATCGNGHDALALAELVGPSGRVYALDLQEAALAATRERLESSLPGGAMPELHLMRACHSRLQELVGSCAARVVVFNLGYLPAGDKSITTNAATTVAALEAALEVLQPGGLVTVIAYTGHPGGLEEYEAARQLLAGLSHAYWVSSELRLLNRASAPVLLLLWRRSDGGGAPAAPGARA
ncbi:MAG: putative rRNA methylase-domain-containing protein [Monoraphidium minutum]|nr:MAG: putative rRNA methylase-domain-containing protein [Monoraphidium minutum]